MKKEIVFLCGARDYHAIDWYRSALFLLPDTEIVILTDLIAGEGFKKLINKSDKVYKLFIIDKYLFKKQSIYGNLWRNFIKILFFPLQVLLLKNFAKKYPNAIYHAHSMYYLWLAWAANIPFIGTPQGSDILLKPFKSYIYKYLSKKALQAAKAITVDSLAMKLKVFQISKKVAYLIQNGIDITDIQETISKINIDASERTRVISIRGFTALYDIKQIVKSRNSSKNFTYPISFIYPFYDEKYKNEVNTLLKSFDEDFGRVTRNEMYRLFMKSLLVISIPKSDSSPRSVYEAIFCGCAVAIRYQPYYDTLPDCMKEKIIIIDVNDNNWFDAALQKAREIIKNDFKPSKDVLTYFDQRKSFEIVKEIYYNG